MRWGVFGAARDICDRRSDNIGHDSVARGALIPANQSVPLIVDALTLSVVRLSESRKDEGRDLLRQGRRRETWRGLSPVRSVVSRPYSSMLGANRPLRVILSVSAWNWQPLQRLP
jgi:hypothetical protein